MAAVASVAINLDSRGVPAKLKQVADRSKEVSVAVDRMNGKVGKSSRQFKNAGVAASQASAAFNKFGKAIGGIVTAAAAFQALKFTIVKTAELETQTRSLKVLTGSLESAQSIIKQLQDIGAVTPFTSTELIETAKRLRAFGVETDKLVDTTRRLGDVAGATGADLGGIATAFGQIQAKGRLQGEELLQLQERGIDLQSELQKMYGMTGEEFRKALEKGKFSAEAVDVALQNLTNTGGKYANGAIAQSDTLAGKFSTLQDGITRTAQAIGQVLSPALQTILTQAIGVVNSINSALAAGRRIQQFGIDASQRNELFQQAGREAEEIAKLRGGGRIDPAVFTQLRDERFKDLIEAYGYETGQIQVETKVPTLETPSVPELLGGGAGGGGAAGGAGRSAASIAKEQNRIAEAAAREAEQRRINLRNQDQLIERLRSQIVLQNSFTDGDRIMNKLLMEQLEIRQDIENRMEGADAAMKQRLIEEARLRNQLAMDVAAEPFVRAGMNMGEALAEGLGKANEQADVFKETMQGVGEIMGGAITNAIDGLIDGTADLNKMLSDVLKQVGSLLIRAGLNTLAGGDGIGILSTLGFGTRADGGPVTGGSPYIVGERGPELFVPSSSGSVMSNSDTRAALAQQAAARQSNTTAMTLQTKPLNIRFESTSINGVEYVTAEQHRKGMAQAAERGRALTLQALQNSPRTRTKVGI